jgi:hypothetical protein
MSFGAGYCKVNVDNDTGSVVSAVKGRRRRHGLHYTSNYYQVRGRRIRR